MGTPAVADILSKTSTEQENFYRLSRLLIVGGTTVLRDLLDVIHPPSILSSILANPAVKKVIEKKANGQQKLRLYPPHGKCVKSEDFDISLITLLLQNVCSLKPPLDGWNKMPGDTDQSVSADIVRIRMLRNQVYGHITDMEISDVEFSDRWSKLSDALIRIESNFGENKKREWTDATKNLLTSPLSETDRQNVEELKRWYANDLELRERLSQVELGVNDVKKAIGELKSLYTEVKTKTCLKPHHKDKPLNYFCHDCQERSCELCASVKHRAHKVYASDTDPELAKIRKDINDEILKAENKIASGDDEIQSFSQKVHDARARLEIIENMVHSFAEKCVNEIRHQEQELVKSIERICFQSSLEVEEIKSKVMKQESEIQKAIDCARVLLEKGDSHAICQEASTIKETLQEQSLKFELVFRPRLLEKITFVPFAPVFDDLYTHGIGRISAVDPLKCSARGDGIDTTATLHEGLESEFTITTRDARNEVIHAPSERLSVIVNYKLQKKITHGVFTQDVSEYIRDNRNGTYTVCYSPLKTGAAFVSVKVGCEHITGSPFEVQIKERRYEAQCLIGKKGKGHGNFDGPWGAAENSKGDIYITDRDNNRVQVFDKHKTWKLTFGEFGSDDGQLIQPRGIAVDRHDDVIVVDNGNNRVQIFDKDGRFKMKFGGPGIEAGRFQNPYSVAIDDDENLVVSDVDNQRVQIFNRCGEYVRSFGQGNIKKSCYCIYHEGQYIVSDSESYCVKFFDKTGQFLHSIGKQGMRNGEFDKWIRGLAIDKIGNLLVCDSYADRIQVFRPAGTSFEYDSKFGKEGGKLGAFRQPTTVTVLRNGRFVVCEFYNSRVQIF